MKILIISPFENKATGRGDRNLRLEKELLKRGHEVFYATSDFDHASKLHIRTKQFEEHLKLKVFHIPGYDKNVSSSRVWSHIVFSFKLWVWAIKKQWDVVVVSSVPPESLVAAQLLRRRSLVLDIRDIWPDALLSYNRSSVLTKGFTLYCNAIYRNTLKRADKIIVVAPGFNLWLKKYGALKHGKVKFVPLGFRREDFTPLSNGGHVYDFCYAGGATPQFNIKEFSKELSHMQGVVLGSGPLLEDWRSIFSNSKFFGPVPRREAMKIMSQSRMLLFPSNPFAQLPNKAFDYFSLGHPVKLGNSTTRATRYLLALRHRHVDKEISGWSRYRSIEKEYLAKKSADIIESSIK